MSSINTFLESDKNTINNIIKSYNCSDIYFITGCGNVGDYLIWHGTRTLLNSLNIKYKEISVSDVYKHHGELCLLCGGGAWCRTYNEYMPLHLPIVESNFNNVIVLPSSYEVGVDIVRNALLKSKALFLAREQESYRQIKDICNSKLMHDHAFYFDYSEYIKDGSGVLNAFRTDQESATGIIPENNQDISSLSISLKEWLSIISNYETINTDRAHIMIAGAMMKKKVYYRSGNYHKVPEIAKFSLSEFTIYPLEDTLK